MSANYLLEIDYMIVNKGSEHKIREGLRTSDKPQLFGNQLREKKRKGKKREEREEEKVRKE